MNGFLLFGLSVALSFAGWAFICINYLWPWVRSLSLSHAARPLLAIHTFRFVGASFLIPGVAGTSLSKDFANPAAYGDLIATGLAWVAILLLNRKGGILALWIFNIWGFGDLVFAFYKGAFGPGFEAGFLGATFYIPTVFVPLLICTHIMIFKLLLRRP
ncbi:hypothetical protein ACIQAL_03595 [Pseudomonas sp. NPDC088368]|uniref:hypothetical protein n=1 Tax=Pseudomonas sp. NPDC088368 TaxID=3364453 RepID=UPI003817A998